MVVRCETRIRVCILVGLLSLVSFGSGCSLAEALVDGFFGGISDTVATLVSDSALEVLSAATP